MKHYLILIALVFGNHVFSQNQAEVVEQATALKNSISADTADSNGKSWRLESLFGMNGTQSSFVNWNAGGRNSISLMGYINASADYFKAQFKWDNNFQMSLGGLQYLGESDETETLQKTDDRIEISSTVGRSLKKDGKVFVSIVGGFKTQLLDGYVYPNDSVRVSSWMAPGYLNLALGLDYTPNKHFSSFISPVSSKWTFVTDQRLADAGSFGVDPATYDSFGNRLTLGSRFRSEFGAYARFTYKKEIFKNIKLKSSLELFSNYLDHPENIDVNADVLFTFKVNSWFSASLNLTVIYDNDINILDSKGGYGPRTQFKSVLGIGLSYALKNFEEKK